MEIVEETPNIIIEKTSEIETITNTARNLIEQKKYSEASITYQNALKIFPKNEKLWFEYGYFSYEQKDFPNAKKSLSKSVELSPNINPEKYFTLGEISLAKESKTYYQHGIAIANIELKSEKSPESQKKLKRLISQAYCSLAKLEVDLGLNIPNMIVYLNNAIKADELNLEPHQHFVTIYYNSLKERECRAEIKRFLEKLRLISGVCDEEFSFYEVGFFVFFVRLMIEGAMWEEAIFVLEIALGNDVKHLEANYLLAFCSFQFGDLEGCKEVLNYLVEVGIRKSGDKELLEGFNELVTEIKTMKK